MNEPATPDAPALSDEIIQAFERLELVPGDWGALFPLPLIYAAWSDDYLSEAERWQLDATVRELPLLAPAPPREAEPQRLQFLRGLLLNGDARPQEQQQLSDAVELLCWYLAKNCDAQTQRELFDKLDAVAKKGRWLDRDSWDACREHLNKRIDVYLTLPKFDPQGVEPQLPEPDCQPPPMPGVSQWHTLIVLPLARLTREHQGESRDLEEKMQEALDAELRRRSSTLNDYLSGDEWRPVLLTLTGSKAAYAKECFAACMQQLAGGLASRSYDQREQVFDDLSSVAEQVGRRKRGYLRRPWFTVEKIDQAIEQLRQQILRVRREFGQASPAPDIVVASLNEIEQADENVAPADGMPTPPAHAPSVDGPEIQPLSDEERTQHGYAVASPEGAPPTSNAPTEAVAVAPLWDLQVITPEPFTTVAWEECLAEVAEINSQSLRDLLDAPLLFEEHRQAGEAVSIVPADTPLPESLWVVGDLHCDLLAMVNAWRYIQQVSQAQGKTPHVVFLGDFVDRGEQGYETLQYMCRLIRDFPRQIAVLPGNHDEFVWDEQQQRFLVSVDPAETIEQFNAWLQAGDEQSADRVQFAQAAAEFFARRPKALFLPDGTLIAHGGFPHADLLKTINDRADLSSEECQQDFVWLRIANAHRRLPARYSRGCEFGYENFIDFCKLASEKLQIPVIRMMRGHDHVPQRYQCFEDWPYRVITINTMCRNIGEFGVDRFPQACIARLFSDARVEIHPLPIDTREVEKAYLSRPDVDAAANDFPEETP